MPLSPELLESMKLCGWTLEVADGAVRVRDDEGGVIGILDAELHASLIEFFGTRPSAEA